MPSPILARADALMQRRKQGHSEFGDIPVLTDAIDDDEFPVLIDAEGQSIPPSLEGFDVREMAPPIAETPPQPASAFDMADREHLIRELSQRIKQRLIAEMPRIIESTVRDYLAEQDMMITPDTD